MTSGSLFFKLLQEDLKRRLWAIALLLLSFFFLMPVNLALTMENAANTHYFAYNNYEHFFPDSPGPADLAKLLELKTRVVMKQIEFGNGLFVFLMVVAAVVMGTAGFSYLHNKKKVDFYHSIPVKRELLFAVQFITGILIMAAAYLINTLLMAAVAQAYGVSAVSLASAMAKSWLLNLLYYSLMYAVVTIAMMMTGNLVVGLLASGVFFFFLPGIMMLLAGYCSTFFVTTADQFWMSEKSPLMWGIKYLSPFSAYITAVGWTGEAEGIGGHIPALITTVLAFFALSVLALQLYRLRPSEAAGKAMAFKKSRPLIRIILTLGFGLAGGMFFWMLQSRMRWGIFGIAMFVVLTHCMIEIIYHFDFKKLFSNRVQLLFCLGGCILVFLSFRYDWYGYDSYIPSKEKVASASIEIGIDTNYIYNDPVIKERNGKSFVTYEFITDEIKDNMELTEIDQVLSIARKGIARAEQGRDSRLGLPETQVVAAEFTVESDSSIQVIGGADGPTSVFVAGKAGGDNASEPKEENYTNLTITYHLTNGRSVSRSYELYLSSIMEEYRQIYDHDQYKEGAYYILRQDSSKFRMALYQEAGRERLSVEDGEALKQLFETYQEELSLLTVDTRLKENPIGAIGFVKQDIYEYVQKQKEKGIYGQREVISDYVQFWPVYPSFTRTIDLLSSQGTEPGSYLQPENLTQIQIWVEGAARSLTEDSSLPEGEMLKELQRQNPYYQPEGYLKIEDQELIGIIMEAAVDGEAHNMNQLPGLMEGNGIYLSLFTEQSHDGIRAYLLKNKITPEIQALFQGLPVNWWEELSN